MPNMPKSQGPIAEAIAATDQSIAKARAETKKRKLWSYVRSDTLIDWANVHKENSVRELADGVGASIAEPKPEDASLPVRVIDAGSYDSISGYTPPGTPYVPGNLVPNESIAKLARLFFERPENVVVEVHHDTVVDKYMFAVWMGEESVPTMAPQF